MISTLQEMIVYGQHEPSCENHGRIIIDRVSAETFVCVFFSHILYIYFIRWVGIKSLTWDFR